MPLGRVAVKFERLLEKFLVPLGRLAVKFERLLMPADGLTRLGAAFAGPGLGALLRAAGAAGAALGAPADGALALFCALTGAANAMAMIATLAATVKVFKAMPLS